MLTEYTEGLKNAKKQIILFSIQNILAFVY